MVYDATARELQWITLTSPSRKTLRFSDLDFSCTSVMKMADVSTDVLTDYTAEANLDLMLRSYGGTSFLRGVSREEIAADARHGESFSCAAPTKRTRAVRP